MISLRSKLKWLAAIVGLTLTIIGLPSDIADAQRLLNEAAKNDWLSFAGSDAFRSLLLGIGLFLLAVVLATNREQLLSRVRSLRVLSSPTRIQTSTGTLAIVNEPGSGRRKQNDKPPAESDRQHRWEHREKFGVLWRVVPIPTVWTRPFASLSSLGLHPKPRIRIEGPYCSHDETLLRFKDLHGDRNLMDDDDIGAMGGSLFCPQCQLSHRPDPNYSGPRRVHDYRREVKRLVEGE